MTSTQPVTEGYMCKTDFDCELGRAKGGNPVYPSIEDLKESRSCWNECGIVKVRVEHVETILEDNF
ncbi:hypothetical protein [Roseibium sp. RKSG952]|uniref:hypothetical protein n=1 Tax=Roseibium sp. RKSG952 TaxID=2529384 RepID=UPI0012BCF07E|nr:hypothetical protein [Roseibium sp. RKSG952]MTH96538.1 hypothetical protein [Roseibium sp. RKSG952]